jgi:hypothetical protein
MDLQVEINAVRAAWSTDHICHVARDFLTACQWELEIDGDWIKVPPDAEIHVHSGAIILSDGGFGDHIVAIVYLGIERPSLLPVYAVLRLYLNAAGQMITEDRYSPSGWRDRSS